MGKSREEIEKAIEKKKKQMENDFTISAVDLYDIEEIAYLLEETENFKGKIFNLEKHKKYLELCEIAQWLDENTLQISHIRIDEPDPTEKNISISVVVRDISNFYGELLEKFMKMMSICDHMLMMTSNSTEVVTFLFGIYDIWDAQKGEKWKTISDCMTLYPMMNVLGKVYVVV